MVEDPDLDHYKRGNPFAVLRSGHDHSKRRCETHSPGNLFFVCALNARDEFNLKDD